MARDLVTVTPETPVAAAATTMARHRVRHLLVTAAGEPRRLLGVVSSHDLYLAAEAGVHPLSPRGQETGGRPVGALMTANPTTITPSTPLADAARILRDRKFGCLPVVDRGELVGVLSEHDVLRAFLRCTGADEPGWEVTCAAPDGSDPAGRLHAAGAAHGLRLDGLATFERDGQPLVLAHLAGRGDDALGAELWRCGLTLLRVRRTGRAAAPTAPAAAPRR